MVALGLVAVAALAGSATAAAYTPDQRAAMGALVEQEMLESGYPGMLVGVWTQGQGRFVEATGVADTASGRRMAVGDQARVGSITKTFTATVILQLVEAGKVRLDDPVKRYLDRVPRGSEVTIRMLLNHTSGIPSLPPGVAHASHVQPHRRWTLNQLIFRGLRQQRVGPPGGQWFYSNVNYLMLGKIAEQVTGQSLNRLYRERVIEPLGLRHTRFVPNGTMPRDGVHGYLRESAAGSLVDTTGWNFSWGSSAAAMVSTLGDLRRYAPAVATGEGLLSRRMQRKRLQFVDTGNDGIGYGLGIFALPIGTTPANTEVYLGHDGIVWGYDSIVLYSPMAKTTIAIIGNTAVELDAFAGNQIHPDLLDLSFDLAAVAQNDIPGL